MENNRDDLCDSSLATKTMDVFLSSPNPRPVSAGWANHIDFSDYSAAEASVRLPKLDHGGRGELLSHSLSQCGLRPIIQTAHAAAFSSPNASLRFAIAMIEPYCARQPVFNHPQWPDQGAI